MLSDIIPCDIGKRFRKQQKSFFHIFLEITSGKPVKGKELTACQIDFDNNIFYTPNSKMNRQLYTSYSQGLSFLKDFFFKVFIELITILILLFPMFFFLMVTRYMGSQFLDQELTPAPPAQDGEVLTSGLPGKSQKTRLKGKKFLRYSKNSHYLFVFEDTD